MVASKGGRLIIPLGSRWWSIQPTIESGDGAALVEPWEGIVSGTGDEIVWLSRPLPDSDEPDDDANATAICYPEDLFRTQVAAEEALRSRRRGHPTQTTT